MIRAIATLITGLLAAGGLGGASITIAAIGAFGQSIDGCAVKGFSVVDGPAATSRNYAADFHGLHGEGLSPGQYEVTLRCGDEEIRRSVTLNQATQFELLSRSERFLISDHVKPELSVKLVQSAPSDEVAWIRLVGLYNGEAYSAEFGRVTGVARLTDPEPGSYLVLVESDHGPSCSREVDLVESTRSWTVDRSCTFHVDGFAHVVTEGDKRAQKRAEWYQEMLQQRARLMQILRDAAEK